MITDLHPADSGSHKSRHFDVAAILFQVGRVLLLAALFFSFFLLAHSMAHHRFIEGGWYNRNGTICP